MAVHPVLIYIQSYLASNIMIMVKKVVKPVKKSVKKSVAKLTKKVVSRPLVKKVEVKKIEKKRAVFIPQSVRGMRDILPADQPYWERVRKALSEHAIEYGFNRIDVPAVESTALFVRSVGESTDVVDKELYNFETKGGDEVALRPEFTAGMARAYIEHGMHIWAKPVKLYTYGSLYRHDRPQEGRYREFFQGDFEIFGEQDPIVDAQIIQLTYSFLRTLGLKEISFQVNTLGTPECRKDYLKTLVRYLEAQRSRLCEVCRERIKTSPLRVLDCKEEKCQQVAALAPKLSDFLDAQSRAHFHALLSYLDEIEIPYTVNHNLVRGLDYYTHTVFEVQSTSPDGMSLSLGGGGRYDRLIEQLGGPEPTPAIGVGLGLDRIVLEMQRVEAKSYVAPTPRVFIAQLGELAKRKGLRMFVDLTRQGILLGESFGRGSLKSQMRAANRLGCDVCLILGQKEALDGTVILKDMISGTQEIVVADKLVEGVRKLLKMNQALLDAGHKPRPIED